MKINSAEFIKSATQPSQYPPAVFPEVAFAGRSNVGKSSLINTLISRKKLAKTSSVPGKTRLINFFLINKRLYFVDLPGYGFAKVPLSVKKSWGPMVEQYLKDRESLGLVVVIIDIRREPSEEDLSLIHWLSFYDRDVVFVLTKADKLSKNQMNSRVKEIRKHIRTVADSDIILFSSKTGYGKEALWKKIIESVRT